MGSVIKKLAACRRSLILALVIAAYAPAPSLSEPTREPFGTLEDGTRVDIFTLTNANGVETRITNYGGIVISIKVPDRSGRFGDVTLGYDKLADYVKQNPYFGCLVGRYGNRIAKGRFTLDGKEYQLAVNNGPNHLHGGVKGFDKVVWTAKPVQTKDGQALELAYVSKDGEEGYPGNLSVTAVYTLTHANELRLDYTAVTDKPTIVNLTQHSYFNLAGDGDILNHEVMIAADRFAPINADLIPTGELLPVAGTPFDFTKSTPIGARIKDGDEPGVRTQDPAIRQLVFGRGYDHCWAFNKPPGRLDLAARVYEPTSGRVLEVLTTEPGMQFYSGNFLDGTIVGKGGRIYRFRTGFCMEPQHFPDSPNKPGFPSVVLRPGEVYTNTIIYKFSVR